MYFTESQHNQKSQQLFIDANNLVSIPKEPSILLYLGITLIFKKIRKYFPKVHYIMSISIRVRR